MSWSSPAIDELAGSSYEVAPVNGGGGGVASSVVFTDVTAAAGINYVHHSRAAGAEPVFMSGGAAAGDFDGDGWVDLYVTRLDDPDIAYRNKGDGTFEVFNLNPLAEQTNGAAYADIDNDGDLDLYVTTIDDTRFYLYINQGDGTFSEEAVLRGADLTSPDGRLHNGFSITFGDYDRDGFLDIFTTEWNGLPNDADSKTRLLRNLGASNPGFFEDTTDAAGVNMDFVDTFGIKRVHAFSSRFADMDADGYPDLVVSGDFGTSKLFWNNGDGTFTDGTVAAGVGTDENGMGSAVADFDGDGLLDWFVTSIFESGQASGGWGITGNRLYRNLGNRQFEDVTTTAGVREGDWGWGAAFLDYDNDGQLDLIMTNGFVNPSFPQEDFFNTDLMHLWHNNGDGTFTETSTAAGITDTGSGKGLLTFDYDHDGDLDVFVVNNAGQPVLYRNDGGNANDYLRVKTVGTLSNRDGLGTVITITPEAGGPSQTREINAGSHYLGQSEFIAHFGLGDMSTDANGLIDRIEVVWPSGATQLLTFVSPTSLGGNNPLILTEPALALTGDINGNLTVDIDDFTIWADDFNKSGPRLISDLSGNGNVNIDDFTIWADHFTGPNPATPSATSDTFADAPSILDSSADAAGIRVTPTVEINPKIVAATDALMQQGQINWFLYNLFQNLVNDLQSGEES